MCSPGAKPTATVDGLFQYLALRYLLLGLAAIITDGGHTAPIFDYLAAYAVMTIGLFRDRGRLSSRWRIRRGPDYFNGLYTRNPLRSHCLDDCSTQFDWYSANGWFLAKLQIFMTTINAQSTPILVVAIIMALNAAVGASTISA